jgi:hypothetical protein
MRRTRFSIAAHVFQRAASAATAAGKSTSSMSTALAEDLARMLPGYLTG